MIRSNKGKVTLDGTGQEILADLGTAIVAIYGAFYDVAEEDGKRDVEDVIVTTVAKGLSLGKKKAEKSREDDLDPEIKKALHRATKELIQILKDEEDNE